MSCSTNEFNLRVDQGSRFHATIKVLESGVALDLTGYTARAQVRSTVGSDSVLAEWTTDNGLLVVHPEDSTVRIVLPSSATESYTWESGVYDLEIVDPSSDAIRVVHGWARVSPQVTR